MGLPEIRQIELAGLKAWPGIEVEHDGKWVRRAAGGYTKRANSVQCLDPTDDENAPARIAGSRRWFEARGLMPVFRVTPLAGRCLTESLDEMGWKAFDHSRVLVMALERRNIEPDARVEVLPTDDPKWLSAQRLLQGAAVEPGDLRGGGAGARNRIEVAVDDNHVDGAPARLGDGARQRLAANDRGAATTVGRVVGDAAAQVVAQRPSSLHVRRRRRVRRHRPHAGGRADRWCHRGRADVSVAAGALRSPADRF